MEFNKNSQTDKNLKQKNVTNNWKLFENISLADQNAAIP